MTYGSASGVAALASLWTDDGEWVDPVDAYSIRGTNPSLTTVETWLVNLSSQMDTCLKSNWFNAPADETDNPVSFKSVSQYVNELAANLAREANGADANSSSPGKTLKDMCTWVEDNADSFLGDGMTQTVTPNLKKQVRMSVIGTLPKR